MTDINCIIGNKILDKMLNSEYNYLSNKTKHHAIEFIQFYLSKFDIYTLKKQFKKKIYFNKFLENIEYFKFYINIYDKLYENNEKILEQCEIRTRLLIDTIFSLQKNKLNNDNLIWIINILLKYELTNINIMKLCDINNIDDYLMFIEQLSLEEAKMYFTDNTKFINDVTQLFNDNNIEIKFTFILDEIINEDIKETFKNLNINTEKDLDITKLKLVLLDIYNKWKDELKFGNSSTYDIIISYLYTINELPYKLSYKDLNYCLSRYGRFTNKYSMRDCINNIIQNNKWLEEYIIKNYNKKK